jgi:uncharacterized protein involved in exopolysaccharide biosynthesis
MGFFWDLLQQYQIGKNSSATASQTERLAQLERDVQVASQIMEQMARRLDELDQAVFQAEPDQLTDSLPPQQLP